MMASEGEIEAAAKALAARSTGGMPFGKLPPGVQRSWRETARLAVLAAEDHRGKQHPERLDMADYIASMCRMGREGRVPDSGDLEYGEMMADKVREQEVLRGPEHY